MSFICSYMVQMTKGKKLPSGNFPIRYSFSGIVMYETFIWGHTGTNRNRAARLSSGQGLPATELRPVCCGFVAAAHLPGVSLFVIYEVYND